MNPERVDPQQQVIAYYRRLESRLGYTLLLGGTKHFGWYPPGSERLPMRAALTLMEDRLGRALDLPRAALVLDAGCGRGAVERSEERRVGKECERLCRSRWSPYH